MKALLWISAGLACCLTVMYTFRMDAWTALTIMPAWAWLITVIPFISSMRPKNKWPALVFVVSWVVFAVVHIEEPRSMLRGLFKPVSRVKDPGTLRVVTFNCSSTGTAMFPEIEVWTPDIVLLQESPPYSEAMQLAHRLFGPSGTCIWDFGTSIIARGPLDDAKQVKNLSLYTMAVMLSSMYGRVTLASLRLQPSDPRIDLWKAECWRSQAETRRLQRMQLGMVVSNMPATGTLIVGGDFNVAQHDGIFGTMPGRLRDSFAEAGRGFGNTILNDIPMVRIDQIWLSDDLRAVQSFAVKTRCSDHRMVITDAKSAGKPYNIVPQSAANKEMSP